MSMHFVFVTDDRSTVKNVAEIVDGEKNGEFMTIDKNGDCLYAFARNFTYRCDMAMGMLKASDALNIRYTGAVLDGSGLLYHFNPKNGPGTRIQKNDEQYGSLPDIGEIWNIIEAQTVSA